MPVVPEGSLNPNATLAPGVYVIEQLPEPIVRGEPTDIIGVVGTATWGPVNSPTVIGSLSDYTSLFGNPQDANFDMGTQVYAATSLTANDLRCVRVTDGSDLAASTDLIDTSLAVGLTLTSKYTGTRGNLINATVGGGTNSTVADPTYKLSIFFPTGSGVTVPEIFDNIGGATPAEAWANMVLAVNVGQGNSRPPSDLAVAVVGAAIAAPDSLSYVMSGGTNGGSVSDSDLVGLDSASNRTGMFALRGSGFNILVLSDSTDSSFFVPQASLAQEEGAYAILTRPSGESIADTIAAKKAAGLDSPFAKLMVADYVRINDGFNGVQRFVSPQGFVAGRLANLSPEESGLNKAINSTIFLSTQTNDNNQTYSSAEKVEMLLNGLDVIATPSPGGTYFAQQTGKNTSSNDLADGDEYTRLTNFIAFSLFDSLGSYIGRLQTPAVRQSARTAIQSFLQSLQDAGQIGAVNGGPAYRVVLDASNNPCERVALGYMQADVQVAFFKVIIAFLVNLQTGEVSINGTSNP